MADMPKLVDMAYTKAELKEERAERGIGPDGQISLYPWGLCIRLEKEELDKLGITDLPEVGGEIHLMAVATITNVSQSVRNDTDEERSVGLQITEMQVLLTESAAEEKAEGKETPAKEGAETRSVLSKYKG